MATLLDTIRGNLTQQAAQPQVGMADEGEKVRKLLGAKTGKGASQASSSIAQSNLAEGAAVDQTRQGQEQLAQQGQVQAVQIGQQQAGLQEQERQGREQVNLQQRANTLQNAVQTDQLLNDLSRDQASLDLDKDSARLEQVAQNLAFQDRKYVDQLQQVGERNRLDDSLAFKKELANAVFKDNIDILSEDIIMKAAAAKDVREFNKIMAQQGLFDMIAVNNANMANAKQRGMYEGLGQVASAGAQAYAASGSKEE